MSDQSRFFFLMIRRPPRSTQRRSSAASDVSKRPAYESAQLDCALIGAAQKVEHYEISGYGTLRTVAEKAGHTKVARLLAQTLAEEEKTDKLLTTLSAPLLDQASQDSEGEEEEM